MAHLGDVGAVDAAVARGQFRRLIGRATVFVARAVVGVAAAAVVRTAARSASGDAVRVLIRNGDTRAVADVGPLDGRHLRLEHIHGDDVDDHDPARAVEQFHVVLGEGDGRDALHLQFAPIRIGAFHFARHVLLEFLHVEQLMAKEQARVR